MTINEFDNFSGYDNLTFHYEKSSQRLPGALFSYTIELRLALDDCAGWADPYASSAGDAIFFLDDVDRAV